jgi:hypothetical protein
MSQQGRSDSEPIIVGLDETPVNLEWELLNLTGDHPAFCVYAQIRDVNDDAAISRQIDGEPTDRAWISITSSLFSSPPRVLVTPDELRSIAQLCLRFAHTLERRERQR